MIAFRKIVVAAILVSAALFMSGCSASYNQSFLQNPIAMNQQASVLVVTPENGSYGDQYYATSGSDVVQVLSRELRKYATNISVIRTTVSINDITDSDLQGFDYIFIPQILHWEDRATGWSFRPDRIEVRFDIYDSQRNMVNSVDIKGKSANVVWVQKAPNSLLARPIRQFLADLFR